MVNETLRLLVTGDSPGVFKNCEIYPTFYPTLSCLFPGWIMEISQMVADYANITIEPILATANETKNGVGSFFNGSWNGYLGEIWKEDVDTVTSFYQLTTERSKYFTYSYPVYSVSIIYVAGIRQRVLSDVIWNVFSSYNTSLWIVLLVGFLIQVFVGTIIRRVEWKLELIPKFDSHEKLWQYARLIVDQGDDRIPFETSSGNFAFLFYALLEITLFAGLYQGPMVNAALQETNPSPIQSPTHFIKLIETKQYSIVTYKTQYETFWFYNNVRMSNESYYVQIRHAIVRNPIIIKSDLNETLNMITRGRYIYITQEGGIGRLPEKYGYYVFKPGNPLINKWNDAIKMNDGFIRRTYIKYFDMNFAIYKPPKCPQLTAYATEAEKPLGLLDFFGIFLVFFVGTICSIIGYIAEILVHCHFKNRPMNLKTKKKVFNLEVLNNYFSLKLDYVASKLFNIKNKILVHLKLKS